MLLRDRRCKGSINEETAIMLELYVLLPTENIPADAGPRAEKLKMLWLLLTLLTELSNHDDNDVVPSKAGFYVPRTCIA